MEAYRNAMLYNRQAFEGKTVSGPIVREVSAALPLNLNKRNYISSLNRCWRPISLCAVYHIKDYIYAFTGYNR